MRVERLTVTIAALSLVGAACGGGSSGAALSITSPEEGAEIGGNVVSLAIDASGIEIVPPDGDTSGETGHFHVFVDREPLAAGQEIPREAGIVHSATNPVQVTGLSPGEHTFTVVYGDGAHKRIGDTESSVTVSTEGPSIKASGEAAANSIVVTVQTTDVDIVAEPPSEQHLHYFLDSTPAMDGTPIPTDDPKIVHSRELTVTFDAVEPGEHTISVVVGDGSHVPLDPPVMDVIRVTVA